MINKTEIQQKAETLLNLPIAAGEFPVPAERIATHLGFECHLFKPNSETSNVSGAVNHKTKKIFINENDSPQRQFFTLAHELGHIMLHGDQQDYIDYRDDSVSTEKEAQANYFAASLLMPEREFRHQWKTYKKDLDRLRRFFGVSLTAIAIRADSLGLTD